MRDDVAGPDGSALSEGLGLAPERETFGELTNCKHCGGLPYAYDLRGTDTHEICTVECDGCNYSAEGATPRDAADEWNRRA
jgi:hypothetical protein